MLIKQAFDEREMVRRVEISVIETTAEASNRVLFAFRFVLCSGPLACLAQNAPKLKEYLDLKLQRLESSLLFGLWLIELTLSGGAPCCVVIYSVRNLL